MYCTEGFVTEVRGHSSMAGLFLLLKFIKKLNQKKITCLHWIKVDFCLVFVRTNSGIYEVLMICITDSHLVFKSPIASFCLVLITILSLAFMSLITGIHHWILYGY